MSVNPFQELEINKSSTVPIYQQLVAALNCIIKLMQLEPGTLLPPIRVLAVHLQVNPNTVARAYQELKMAGAITKKRGSGCVVAGGPGSNNPSLLEQAFQSKIDELITQASAMGIGKKDLLGQIEERAETLIPVRGKFASPLPPASRQPTSQREVPAVNATPPWQPEEGFID